MELILNLKNPTSALKSQSPHAPFSSQNFPSKDGNAEHSAQYSNNERTENIKIKTS
jgi:hypothetical protein